MSELCARCGHRLVSHGDRAITACDGGAIDLTLPHVWGPRMPLCACEGWLSK